MKLLFKNNSEYDLSWYAWSDLPAASVYIHNDHLSSENEHLLFLSLEEGMHKLYSMNRHRTFIFFSADQFARAERFLKWTRRSESQIEVFVEVCQPLTEISKYQYEGLQEYLSGQASEKFLILSIAPTRQFQAQRLHVYLDEK